MTQRQMSAVNGRSLFHGSAEAHDRQNYLYPPVPPLQQPPPARINDAKKSSEQATGPTRVRSPVSSVSGSSGLSYQKHHPSSSGSRWPSPTLERTLVNSDQARPRQSGQWQPSGPAGVVQSYNRSEMAETNSPALAYVRARRQIEEQDKHEEDNDHAMWVVFWLSCLDPLHSLASCFFTLLVAFGLLLASPVRLVHKQNSFGDQLIRTVAPLFKHHLEMMYAPSVDYAFEWDFQPGMLIAVHLVAPLVSVGVALAACVTGAFWIFTSIMGNPDGTERRDDGADAILAVRNWWERCLLGAIKPRVTPSTRAVV